MPDPLADSFRYCQRLARRTGKNFYWSFLTLPRDMRRDMCALYAFMRQTDDLGDDESQPLASRQQALAAWRQQLSDALQKEPTSSAPGARSTSAPLHTTGLPALADVVSRRRIDPKLLNDVVHGVESDLTPHETTAFADLERYCYHVAGAVGLCCIAIWGGSGEAARRHAIDCGTAFQLTNILRDLQEDAQRGRVYLPTEDLQRFQVTPDELRRGEFSDRFRKLMSFEVERARTYYASGAKLLPLLSKPGRRIHSAMLRIYGGLLEAIERRGYNVFERRIELSSSQKLGIAIRSWWRPHDGSAAHVPVASRLI
jgi:phytoene synthase